METGVTAPIKTNYKGNRNGCKVEERKEGRKIWKGARKWKVNDDAAEAFLPDLIIRTFENLPGPAIFISQCVPGRKLNSKRDIEGVVRPVALPPASFSI